MRAEEGKTNKQKKIAERVEESLHVAFED